MLVFTCLILIAIASAQQQKPNFVVILTDDQGFDDYGFRQPPLRTANMYKLMHEGVQFTRFYTGPACAQTRSQLMTGRNFLRTRTSAVGFGGDGPHLDEYLLSEAVKDGGYVTGMVGKWNLGLSDADLPIRRGFDETWEVSKEEVRGYGKYNHFNAPFFHNGTYVGYQPVWQDEFATDKAIDFIRRHKTENFSSTSPILNRTDRGSAARSCSKSTWQWALANLILCSWACWNNWIPRLGGFSGHWKRMDFPTTLWWLSSVITARNQRNGFFVRTRRATTYSPESGNISMKQNGQHREFTNWARFHLRGEIKLYS